MTFSGFSFGNNLCFRCPNEQCKLVLDIYIPRAFQWYKECHKPLSFELWNCSLKFRESIGTPSPKVGVALGVRGFTPSHFPTLPGVCDVTPGLPLGPQPCNPFCFGCKPKARVTIVKIVEKSFSKNFSKKILFAILFPSTHDHEPKPWWREKVKHL